MTATSAQYKRATEQAKAKGVHTAPAGDLNLTGNSWQGAADGQCGYGYLKGGGARGRDDDPNAQLRSAYVRVTVGAVVSRGWTEKGGKPKWVPIGVVCPKCGAFWPKPGGVEQ